MATRTIHLLGPAAAACHPDLGCRRPGAGTVDLGLVDQSTVGLHPGAPLPGGLADIEHREAHPPQLVRCGGLAANNDRPLGLGGELSDVDLLGDGRSRSAAIGIARRHRDAVTRRHDQRVRQKPCWRLVGTQLHGVGTRREIELVGAIASGVASSYRNRLAVLHRPEGRIDLSANPLVPALHLDNGVVVRASQ